MESDMMGSSLLLVLLLLGSLIPSVGHSKLRSAHRDGDGFSVELEVEERFNQLVLAGELEAMFLREVT